jgi:hypothetical protein
MRNTQTPPRLCPSLQRFDDAGHTDATGSESYNQGLSERRADAIKNYLVDKFGIAGTDLVTVGYGKSKPKDPAAPMDPTNRRVQVVNMASQTASKCRHDKAVGCLISEILPHC